MKHTQAYNEGYEARLKGFVGDCPYPGEAPEHDEWLDGWAGAYGAWMDQQGYCK